SLRRYIGATESRRYAHRPSPRAQSVRRALVCVLHRTVSASGYRAATAGVGVRTSEQLECDARGRRGASGGASQARISRPSRTCFQRTPMTRRPATGEKRRAASPREPHALPPAQEGGTYLAKLAFADCR